ncbi:MAG: 5-formyltetrahydrofolate cyclo-ligase [Planctomycetota bacterium]
MAPPPHDKTTWRRELKRRLAQRSAGMDEAQRLAERFFTVCPDATAVLLYAATAQEAPTSAFTGLPWRSSVRVAFPAITSNHTLEAYAVGDPMELVPDRYGILALDAGQRTDQRRVPPEQINAVAVPALGFDLKTGVRLGRGGGYYDRFLSDCSNALRIGVAFDEQIVLGLPAEPHDIPMHAVVTPTRTLRFEPSK